MQENLQQWLINEKGRDQFVIRAGSETEIMWNDARQLKADSVDKRPVSWILSKSFKIPRFLYFHHS